MNEWFIMLIFVIYTYLMASIWEKLVFSLMNALPELLVGILFLIWLFLAVYLFALIGEYKNKLCKKIENAIRKTYTFDKALEYSISELKKGENWIDLSSKVSDMWPEYASYSDFIVKEAREIFSKEE
ncbi:MAG: hypothetical protein JAZ19_08720 [Candidatus Thiodiazotropha taylori]|nr:hypothetical protein [Candidatus Thiodiazotropha taylori]